MITGTSLDIEAKADAVIVELVSRLTGRLL
jgi:hypothetical protein